MRPFGFDCRKLRTTITFPAPLVLTHLFLIFLNPHDADATNDDSIKHVDHNHHRLLNLPKVLELQDGGGIYESDFVGADRSIIGRAPTDETALVNNVPGQLNIEQGDSQYWTFPSQALTGPKSPQTSRLPSAFPGHSDYTAPASSDGTTLYISLNTCLQPTPQSPNTHSAPDQLKLYVSTSSNNQRPSSNENNLVVPVEGGFASLNITSVKSDVYFGVFAPKNEKFTGVYNYELAVSIDGFYASYYNETELYFVDSDTSSALLYTYNTTNANSSKSVFKDWMNGTRFTMFVQNQDDISLSGMQNSYCALKNLAQVQQPDIDTNMTILNNGQPQQQFHAKTLNGSSAYHAILAVDGNSTASGSGVVGGGGIVWNSLGFTTKRGTFLICIDY